MHETIGLGKAIKAFFLIEVTHKSEDALKICLPHGGYGIQNPETPPIIRRFDMYANTETTNLNYRACTQFNSEYLWSKIPVYIFELNVNCFSRLQTRCYYN